MRNMEKPISQGLKILFLVHAIVSALLGLGLWLVPGRFLTLIGWVPAWVTVLDTDLQVPGTTFVDAFITRLLGTALLALAYSSFRGWRLSQWSEVAQVVQLEIVFCVLGFLSLILSLYQTSLDVATVAYVFLFLLAGFAVAWLWAWRAHSKG
jgi:hypothetical protein